MKKRRLAACLLLLVTARIESQTPKKKAESDTACPLFIQVDPPTPYGFAKANLASLWLARNAVRDGVDEMKKAQKDPEQSAFSVYTAMMRGTKLSTNDFVCAKKVLEPYTSPKTQLRSATASQRENVKVAAQFAAMVYDQQIEINQRLLDLLKKVPTSNFDLAQFSDQISTLQVERGQRWSDLVKPTTIALMMLVDMRPTDDDGNFIQTTDPNVGHTKRLVIAKQQKQELLDSMADYFPEFQDGTPEDQWSDPAKTAKMYLTLFKGRKCSDE